MIWTLDGFYSSDIFFHPDYYDDDDIVILKGNKFDD